MTKKATFLERYDQFSKLSEHVSVGATRKANDLVGVARCLAEDNASNNVQAFLEHLGETECGPTEGQATETPRGKAR